MFTPAILRLEPDVALFGATLQHGGAGAVDRLVLRGELDLVGAHALEDAVRHVGAGRPFAVDCGGLTFIDAAGIGALLRAYHRGGSVTDVPGCVERVLRIAGVGELVRRTPRTDYAVGGRHHAVG
jgi:anti-anti-sigma factor